MSDAADGLGFSPEEARTLSSVQDEIIPRSDDGRLPGAGELGLVETIEAALEPKPELRPLLVEGLAALGERTRARGAEEFANLSKTDRVEVLKELESKLPFFLPAVIALTYVGYYQNPRVLEALGQEARPPHPQGYEVAPTDFSILEPVRKRAPLYRGG
jgi:hypothetical protein